MHKQNSPIFISYLSHLEPNELTAPRYYHVKIPSTTRDKVSAEPQISQTNHRSKHRNKK